MSTVQNPTYLLAPNWTFRPGGRIALGNIIVDPFRPHRPLTKPDGVKRLETETVTEKNWQLSLETARRVNISIWAIFLENIHLKIGGSSERVKNGYFTMESLDTVFLKEDPTDEEIVQRCNQPQVREYMRLDSVLCKPIYMVTGLKIAKGFALKSQKSSAAGFIAEGSGEAAPNMSLGGSFESSKQTSVSDQFETENDIIFAYQLLKIKPKGWTKNKFKHHDFEPRQAFLAEEKEEEPGNIAAERDSFVADDLRELGTSVQMVEVQDGKQDSVYIVFESC